MNHFTFSWGKNYIAVRGLLRVLGQDLVDPPPFAGSVVARGINLAHPFLCFSGKLVLGQLGVQIARGDRRMVFMSSLGPEACRCADTSDYVESLFCDCTGFTAHRIGGNGFGDALANLRANLGPKIRKRDCYRAYVVFYAKVDLLHKVDKRCTRLRCLSTTPERVREIEAEALHRIDQARGPIGLWRVSRWFDRMAALLPMREEPPRLRIGVVGGEHILSEADDIMGRLKDLAEQDILLDWRSGFRMMARSSSKTLAPLKARCAGYLDEAPSTSEIFSCAHALDFIDEAYDGLLHIYAFGCMPQTAAKPILQRIALDSETPLLSLSIGDRFAEEGFENRLEAFIDLLSARKHKGVFS